MKRTAFPHPASRTSDRTTDGTRDGASRPIEACRLCLADVIHCHEVSVEHADGSTACADPWCNLPHHLHDWQLACDAFAPPCPCAGDEHLLDLDVSRAA